MIELYMNDLLLMLFDRGISMMVSMDGGDIRIRFEEQLIGRHLASDILINPQLLLGTDVDILRATIEQSLRDFDTKRGSQ